MKIYQIADNGYKFDKRIFWSAMLIMVGAFLYVAADNNFNLRYQFYYECEAVRCKNPFMDQAFQMWNTYTDYDYKTDCVDPWCKQKWLNRGVYGKRQPLLFNYFTPLSFGLVILGLLLNHLIHNKGKQPSLKFNLSDRTRDKFRKWYGGILEDEKDIYNGTNESGERSDEGQGDRKEKRSRENGTMDNQQGPKVNGLQTENNNRKPPSI